MLWRAALRCAGPALTIEERIEERLAFKLNFYKVRNKLCSLLTPSGAEDSLAQWTAAAQLPAPSTCCVSLDMQLWLF